jgi:hypothetical protein
MLLNVYHIVGDIRDEIVKKLYHEIKRSYLWSMRKKFCLFKWMFSVV